MSPSIEPAYKLTSEDYHQKNGKWFWREYECVGVDPASFVPMNNTWAIDAKGLIKQDKRVRVKDPKTCRVLNLLFAKDDYQVYYIEGVAKEVVDVSTFEVLDAGIYDNGSPAGFGRRFGYARDSQQIYGHDFFSGKPKVVRGADRDTFTRLTFGYAKDHKHVWTQGTRIAGVDPASFEAIDDLYSKDRKRAYYYETPLEESDPATFRPIGDCHGRDAHRVYFQRGFVAGADPETYVCDAYGVHTGRDAKCAFVSGRLVAGADPDTFQDLGSYYYRDTDRAYYGPEAIPGADAKTFSVGGTVGGNARDKYRTYKDGKTVASSPQQTSTPDNASGPNGSPGEKLTSSMWQWFRRR